MQNPSAAELGDCFLIQGLYYCVEVNFNPLTTATSTTSIPSPSSTTATTTTKTPTSTMVTTVTKTTGVATPTPIQTGTASNCDDFYLVQSGDTCDIIAAAEGISVSDLYAWNPAVGVNTCRTLLAGYYICVGVKGSSTTTTTTRTTTTAATTTAPLGNGIATPTPFQAGMVSDCNDFYLVRSGDTCDTIAAREGILVSDFYKWNPTVGVNTCKTLLAANYVCIGVQSCTTNSFGLVVPKPAGANCGISAVSNGGTTLVSYSSGKQVSSLLGCRDAWYVPFIISFNSKNLL